jgi:transposase-like protein
MNKHRPFNPAFKAKVVLQVLSGEKTAAEVCREQGLKPDLFSKWKATFLANAAQVFEREATTDPQQARIEALERLAGQLSLELEIAKKVSQRWRSPQRSNAS